MVQFCLRIRSVQVKPLWRLRWLCFEEKIRGESYLRWLRLEREDVAEQAVERVAIYGIVKCAI